MGRTIALTLGFLAAGMALLHGIVTLNPFSVFEGGLMAVNTMVLTPDSAEKTPPVEKK